MTKKPANTPVFVPKASAKPVADASPELISTTAVSSPPPTDTHSVNFLAIANEQPLNGKLTSGFVTHQQNADMSSLPGGLNYIPTSTTLPYLGDPIGVPHQDEWKRGLIGPNPGDFGWPQNPTYPYPVNPTPNITSTVTFFTNKWGVQKKQDKDKGGAEYWVVNPFTMPYIESLGTATIVAHCDTENDANYVCRLLNEDHARTSLGPAKTCSCNGINEECSNCPPERKNVAATITYNHAKDSLKSLEGRVLTVIDAAIESESRNKALKTLFKREFRKTITQFFDFCHRHFDGDLCDDVADPDE